MKKRVMLKLSGESLKGSNEFGYDATEMLRIAGEVSQVCKQGFEICIVIGGGNIHRGASFSPGMPEEVKNKITRADSDKIGMLATLMNGLMFASFLNALDQNAEVFSAFEIASVCKPINKLNIEEAFKDNAVVILCGGTGNPYFSTDTAAVLRALEFDCQEVIKATQVDGVYDKDPNKHADAKKYQSLTFAEVIDKKLAIMDQLAFVLAHENNMPIKVFSIQSIGELQRVVKSEGNFSLIR